MANKFLAPGVIVKEQSVLPKTVVALRSSVPAFLGHTNSGVGKWSRVTNLSDFDRLFGGSEVHVNTFLNGNGNPAQSYDYYQPKRFFYLSLSLYFQNGGGPCWVYGLGATPQTVVVQSIKDALVEAERIEEVALVLYPELPNVLAGSEVTPADNTKRAEIVRAILAHCARCGNRMALFDVFMRWRTAGSQLSEVNDTRSFREQAGHQYLSYGAAYYPQIELSGSLSESAVKLSKSNESEACIHGLTLARAVELSMEDSDLGREVAKVMLPYLANLRKKVAAIRPHIGGSPAVAALIGKVDRERGEWKAPANLVVDGAARAIDIWWGADNDALGQKEGEPDTMGKDINQLKTHDRGLLVWGARTLAGNDADYRYISVRRTLMMIGKSLKAATEYAVFEPNVASTWLHIKAMCENFLSDLWRAGALMGAKPEEAFKVQVGLGQSMTSEDILQGILRIHVSLSLVRPAEFVELRFSHYLQPA